MLNIPEQPNQFRSPEDEIESLKKRIEEIKASSPEKESEATVEAVKEHTKKAPEEALHEEYIYTPNKEYLEIHHAVIFDLPPEEHDQKIAELLKLSEEKGILNVINLIMKTNNAHLLDDFERALARKMAGSINN